MVEDNAIVSPQVLIRRRRDFLSLILKELRDDVAFDKGIVHTR